MKQILVGFDDRRNVYIACVTEIPYTEIIERTDTTCETEEYSKA